ncbi:MAG: metal-dependent transcriptional regulator [Clostridiales bacterium]|nr:metal-dependent transcriptional regulator [Clostridiales bacterium]
MVKLSSSLEDYIEAIYILVQQGGEARLTDVADFLNVSQPSVSRAIGTLKDAGLVVHESYGQISLSPKGKTQAKKVLGRHMLFKRFLTDTLGVDEATAEKDACRMEHVVSGETIEKLHAYLESEKKKEV